MTVTASGGSATTINNNANNRLITGSGTANTLEAESGLTYDGTYLNHIGSGFKQLKIDTSTSNSASLLLKNQQGNFTVNTINNAGNRNFTIYDGTAGETRFSINQGGTVGITSGLNVTGVATATTFSGSGASLTNLPAANLTGTIADDRFPATLPAVSGANLTSLDADNLGIGTIPNGRFPATLPAVSGTNLTSLNADNISSGTLASARIEDNAVTFAKMQDVATNVIIGRNTSGSGDMEALSAADVRTLLNVADGATAGITTNITNVQATFNLTYGSSNYRLTGPGQDGTENNPDLYLVRGQRYRITHNAGGAHPLQIRLSDGGTAYTDGVTYSNTGNNTTTNGNNLEINLQHDAPARLYYQCTVHGGMIGNIFVVGGPQHIVGVLTATSFSGNGANVTDVNATTLDSIDSGSFLRSDATDTCSGQVTFTNQLLATRAGIQTNQTGIALVVNHSTNTAMRGNHFIVDDFPSGGGSYFIQATESNVTNDRNLVLQGYGGKVKIGGQGIAPTEVLDVGGNVKATKFVGSGTSLTNLPADQLTGTIDDARLPNTISSDITGNAASADTVDIGTANASQNYYPVFTETNGSSKTVNIDGGNNLTYNPGTNTLSAVTFSATNVTVTGTLTGATLDIGSSNISSGTHTFTASAGSAVAADTTAVGSCNAIEYTIFVSNSSNIQSQKVLIMDNGSTAYSQEFAMMSNPNMIATFSADVNGGNVRLLATPETGISGSTTIKFTKMIIE